ncbi:N-acylglucosamine 2-epimerase [Hydrogenispora ethanolica]|uniref:N-acylglucosamine 2-epimerase n=1 Tax=Hydrogenispora ethanolica TaxID=1082276 RepID=A0A4R1QTP7_HYDET|nr:AGE family epimerase/isomerase [Hydrogenispora ethanolica]TCL56451.1 N-acylglucosamine 2-epimerase [Hydrogenispora ethanolica]
MNRQQLLAEYVGRIQDDFVPYWNRFFDYEKDGILNCINNYGAQKLSDNKFTWSQGRYLWVLGRLYELNKNQIFSHLDNADLLRQMQGIYRFLTRHSIYGDNLCCYLLDRDGNKIKDQKTGRYDASIFADCFALIGMAQYTKTTGLTENLPAVEALYRSITGRIEREEFLTEPYPIPEGYRVHSIPMIMVNTVYEYIKMRERFGMSCEAEIDYGLEKVRSILEDFYRGGYIREHVSTAENYEKRLLDRHVNPGHTLEDMWFCAEFLKDYGDLPKYLPRILELARNAFDIGWDQEYGGLLRFVDREGGKPQGEPGDSDFERLIQDTWDMKLWWPHSETLYVFLYLYELSGEQDLLDRYKKASAYVFSTFPNQELGEWIQIRKRDGAPEEKLVALPVKDPFHILRNFIKIVELYQ